VLWRLSEKINFFGIFSLFLSLSSFKAFSRCGVEDVYVLHT